MSTALVIRKRVCICLLTISMGTPRKNFNFNSPYAQNIGQYPSQTSEYMLQHAGGQQTPQERPRQNFNYNQKQNTPHFYQNRTPQQNCGFYEDKRSSNPNSNTAHFYQNRTSHQQQQGSHGRNFGHRGGRRGQPHHHHQHQRQDQYFHSSMLEDPWAELMQRHNAIHGSVVEDAPKKEFDS